MKFQTNRLEKNDALVFLIKQINYVVNGYQSLSNLLRVNTNTLKNYVNKNQIKTIPSSVFFNIVNLIEEKITKFSFTINEIEDYVISYKSYHGKEISPEFKNQRKLPIIVTPEFESIVYHLMGDGHVTKIGSSEYTQLNKLGKTNFLTKLFNVFGRFNFSMQGFKNGRIYISKTIIKIITNYYGLTPNDFRWDMSYLPEICLKRINSFKLAGLLSFIVDEGHVGKSVITLHSSNFRLLEDIRKITVELDIQCSIIRLKKGKGTTKDSYRFNIVKKGVKCLYSKSIDLRTEYETCNLAQKENKVKKIVN